MQGGGASVNSAEITGGKALLWYYYRITRLSQLILPRTIYPQREGKKERRRNKTTELNHSCVDNIHGNPYTVYIILAQYEGSRLDSWELVLAMENLTKKKDCVFFVTLLSQVWATGTRVWTTQEKFTKRRESDLERTGKKNLRAAKGGDEQRRRWRWGGTHTDRLGNMGEVKVGAPPSSSPSSSL